MPVDYLQLKTKIEQIGIEEPDRLQDIAELSKTVQNYFHGYANELDMLREKVAATAQVDPFIRCAKPASEPLNYRGALPPIPTEATILAADGSQITPDRHAQVYFFLINVGSIEMCAGSAASPVTDVVTELYYGQEIFDIGTISDSYVAQKRDQRERERLSELVAEKSGLVVTITDGPLEIWGGKAQDSEENRSFQEILESHKQALRTLKASGAITAGYVDKPRADLVVQLLELSQAQDKELADVRKQRPFRGVTDSALFRKLLKPGERSAVFAIQSTSSTDYTDDLALHFFYLNVGRAGRPSLARVEIPEWVASNPQMLDDLHAVLVDQCKIMGGRPYPYLLHRSHEIALVTYEEKDQIINMILAELDKQDIEVGDISEKQAAKNLGGRRRFSLGKRSY